MIAPPRDYRRLLVDNLPRLRQLVQRTCARRALLHEADDVLSAVTIKLLERDCAAMRQYDGRGSFCGFLARIVDRFVLDYQTHEWGKWRPSAEARRLGRAAVLLDRMVSRDGVPAAEATAMVAAHLRLPAAEVLQMQEKLTATTVRRRRPRRCGDAVPMAAAPTLACPVEREERTRDAAVVRQALGSALGSLDDAARRLVDMRYVRGMTVRDIALALGADQKQLYREYDRLLARMRRYLTRYGLDACAMRLLLADGECVIEEILAPPPAVMEGSPTQAA